jgi:hypothetical protein
VREPRRTRTVEADLSFVAPGSAINRRFVASGEEVNTGHYEMHSVQIGDARDAAGDFTLDGNGFVLARHESAITDFHDSAEAHVDFMPGRAAGGALPT